MSCRSKALTASEIRYEQERNFDSVAYAEEVMKTLGADFHEDDPLFQTNEFRMHCYKIIPCTKHFCHDWSVCPLAHFSERAKRRDPKEVKYTAIACPDMKKGEDCPRGDRCPYSHNTFEYWLHPTRYRTRLCRDNEACNRKICFFAHKPEEVRVPTSRPSLPISEEQWPVDGPVIKEDKEMESLPNGMRPAAKTETTSLRQSSQLPPYLQRNLNTNSTSANELTFVDQVLNGMLSSDPTSSMSLSDVQNLQIARAAAPNLSFDSCYQPSGLSQGALNSLAAHNGCFPSYHPLSTFGSAALNGLGDPTSQVPFVSSGPQDMSLQQLSFPPPPPLATTQAKTQQPDLSEVLQLLSNIQVVGSPTSVLAQRYANHNTSLPQNAFSIDGSTSSVMGIPDTDLDTTQFANALMGLNASGPTGAGNAGTLFGMTL